MYLQLRYRFLSFIASTSLIFILLIGTLPISAQEDSNRPRTASDSVGALDRETNVVRIESPGVQIGYNQRIHATKVEFRKPTDPQNGKVSGGVANRGSVKIETKGGYTEIDVCGTCEKFDLPGPARNVAEGMHTYVLWVITPTGYAQNISEILYDDDLGGSGSDARYANVATTQPVFSMMITAEPHFAVSQPSRYVVLVSRPQPTNEDNAGLRVADYIAYNPSAAPENIDQTILTRIPPIPSILNSSSSEKFRQVYNNLDQARSSMAMAQTAVENIRIVREIARERTIREAESLIKDSAHKPIYDQMQEALENRLRIPLYEETQSKRALEDANAAYERACASSDKLNPKSGDRLPLLPIVRDARLAVQSAAAAKEFADIAASRVEIMRLKIQVEALVRLNDELAEELRRANSKISELETKLSQANDRIRELEARVADLEHQLQEANRRIADLEKENAKLKNDLDRFCAELKKLIANLGEIVQEGNVVTVRLKSDILFPESVYLLTVDRDLNKDVRPRLAQLALLLQILYKDARFKFVGYTDTVDENDYNQWLSEQRALEVMRFFYAQRVQLMDSIDSLRDDYQQKLDTADQLFDTRQFPEWLPQRKRGGLGADKRKQDTRQTLLSRLSDIVQGKGETQLAVPTADNISEPKNRRVEIQITLPQETSLPYCNGR